MTDLKYDLHQSVDYDYWTDGLVVTDVDLNFEKTAKNLSEKGYQKITWHDAKKELPKYNNYMLGYVCDRRICVVVSWDGTGWSDKNCVCYNIDYWAELPKIEIRR